jgi:hypothetical protein
MRRVVRCRVTAAQQLASNTERTRPPERENPCRRISHRHVPNLLFSRKQRRAKLCSTAPARIVPFALQVWSETGIRFGPCRIALRRPRLRNDSRPRSTSRSQSPQLPSAYSPSYRLWTARTCPRLLIAVTCHRILNNSHNATAQTFSWVSITGATVPEVTPSGGMTSGTSLVDDTANCGCSIRVAIMAAVNSSAAARK